MLAALLTAPVQRALCFLGVLCVLAVNFWAPVLTLAQEEPFSAAWEIDEPPDEGWTVGDPITLRLTAMGPSGVEVILPEFPVQWGDFEVLAQALLEPVQVDDGRLLFARQATVTLWTPGTHTTPEVVVAYRDADGEARQISVEPLSITIVSVLGEDDVDKRDLKPQASLPRPPVWPWVLVGALAVVLLFFAGRWLWRRLRRHRSDVQDAVEAVDDRFPEEIAYEKLDHIAALDLPRRGEFKRHYTLVTECVRAYLEGRYAIPALERTTGELMLALRCARINSQITVALRTLLEEADLVKFARWRPSVALAGDAVTRARHLVDITKPDRTVIGDERDKHEGHEAAVAKT